MPCSTQRSPRTQALALAFLAVLLASLAACRSGRGGAGEVASVYPEPDIVSPTPPAVVAAPSPTPEPASSAIELADDAFESGDLAGALGGYRTFLAGGGGAGADRAVFRLAVLHLSSAGPAHDPEAGYALLRRLVREHPDSPYRMEAQVILGLTARVNGLETEIERLEGQLEALKRIDLVRSPERDSP